jgi:hypothetical protein
MSSETPVGDVLAPKKRGISDKTLLEWLTELQYHASPWSLGMAFGWESWVAGILAALATAGLVYFTNMGALLQLDDMSGSLLLFILPVVVGVVAMIVIARRRTATWVRGQLAKLIAWDGVEPARVRQLAHDSGRDFRAVLAALDEVDQARVKPGGERVRG